MEFIIFLAIIGVIAIIGNIWTLIGIKQDERNGLHKPISQYVWRRRKMLQRSFVLQRSFFMNPR